MKFAAAPPDNPGTLTKYFKSSEDFVYKIPDEVSHEEAVLAEPTAVAVHAVRLVDVRPGETVVVMGSGTIGLSCAAVAKVFGAEKIVLVDILDEKLKFAKAHLGVETYKSDIKATPEENAAALLKQLGLESAGVGTSLQEAGVDTVLECSGAASSIATGIHILRPNGKFVQTGLGRPKIEFPIMALSEKELLVRGCFRYSSGDFELAVGFLRNKVIDVKGLISSVLEFQDATKAWDKTGRGEGIKNLIRGVRD
jgi:D-xylulose reductase